MGLARYFLTRQGANQGQSYGIIVLAALYATYAYYTLGLSQLTRISALWFGLRGNVAVIIAAVTVCGLLYKRSSTATFLVAPVIAWTVFATFIVIGKLKQQGLM